MLNKFMEMFALQQELNNNTAGIGWENGFTTEGRKINWILCVDMEMSELIDSFSWKHWKDINGKSDLDNAKVEAVDIMHFLLSELIRVAAIHSKRDEELKKEIDSYLIKSIKEKRPLQFSKVSKETQLDKLIDFKSAIYTLDIFDLFLNFFTMCDYLDLSFDDLYKLYLGKNVLNQFRQDNGYKDGHYLKIWNGQEDNVIMQDILNSPDNKNISAKGVYSQLEFEYSKLNK